MPALISCLQKATGKDPVTKKPLMDHVVKRGLIAEANRMLRDQDVTVHEAEVTVITEARDQAAADAARVDAALKGKPPAKPGIQAAAPRRPVDRDAATAEAFARMRTSPEESLKLSQDIRQHFERVRAETKQMEAEAPPVVEVDVSGQVAELEAKETLAQEDLERERQAAVQKSGEDIAERYAERILAATDPVKRAALDREARSVSTVQKRGINNRYAEKRRALSRDFQRQTQMAQIKGREAELAATKEGARTEKELRKIRAFSELNALVSALPPSVREEIGGNVTLAQLRASDQSIGAFMAGRIAKIDTELERHFQEVYRERIEQMLAAKKPKRSAAGVVKSTIGADAQEVVDRVTGYIKMTGDAVARRYQEIEASLASGVSPEEESRLLMEQHELATFGAIKHLSASQLEAAHDDLRNTIKTGRSAWGAKEEARLADMKAKAENLVSVLPPATESGVAAKRDGLLNGLMNYARNHTSLVQVLDRLFPGANFIKKWTSDAIAADQSDQAYVREVNTRFFDALAAAAGTRSQWKMGGILEDMRRRRFIAVPDGGMATKNEAIQFLFAWAQPKVQERMREYGWTDAHIQTLVDATADPVSQAAMQFMREAYEEIYQKTDPVYVSQYGMHLPRVEGQYAPMRYRAAGAITEMSPTGMGPTSGITPSSLKARVSHKAELLQVDAMDIFREHLLQMSHWVHFAPLIRETRGVLGKAEVKQALDQQIGRDGVGDLQKHLDTITRNGVARSMEVSGTNGFINYLTQGVAVSGLAFNLFTGVIQGDSLQRWMNAIPMTRWARVFLLHQWVPNIAKGWHSDSVQNRIYGGMNPAMQASLKSGKLTPARLTLAVNAGFWHLRYIDAALTSISSAIVYTDAIKQGMTEEQALQKMDEAVARFSQPTLSVSKSQELLTAGPAKRMLLLFMADPGLKTALAMEGLMNVSRGIKARDLSRIEQGVRAVVAVEVWSLTSQIIMCVWASIFSDDDDEEIWDYRKFIRAAVMAPLQGWFVAGSIAEAGVRMAFDEKWYGGQTQMGRLAGNVNSILNNWDDLMTLDPTDPDFRKAFEKVMDTAGSLLPGGAAAIAAGAKQVSKAAGAIERLGEKLEE